MSKWLEKREKEEISNVQGEEDSRKCIYQA